MEGSAIFWIRSIPGPGKQRLSYMENLFADNQNFVTPSFERKTKTQKKKKNQNNRDKQTKLSVPMPWLLKLRWRLSEKISAASKGWEKPWAKPSIWMHCGVLANQTFFLKKVVGNITNNLKSWSQNLATPNTFKLLKLPHLAKREYVTDFQTKYVVELTAQRLTLTCCLRNRTRW